MAEPIRIIIADDHPIFRSGLRQLLAAHDGIRIIDEVSDGEAALRSIEASVPDVAVVDIDMPKLDGLEVIKQLQTKGIVVPVIFLTMYNDREMFDRAMDLGVRGYVLKESAAREIVDAVFQVNDGKYYTSPALSAHVVGRHMRTSALKKSVPGIDDLTPTERNVLKLIAEGKTSKEIAVAFNVSVRTIDNHRLNISGKLQIHGTHQLLKFAIQNKSWL